MVGFRTGWEKGCSALMEKHCQASGFIKWTQLAMLSSGLPDFVAA